MGEKNSKARRESKVEIFIEDLESVTQVFQCRILIRISRDHDSNILGLIDIAKEEF